MSLTLFVALAAVTQFPAADPSRPAVGDSAPPAAAAPHDEAPSWRAGAPARDTAPTNPDAGVGRRAPEANPADKAATSGADEADRTMVPMGPHTRRISAADLIDVALRTHEGDKTRGRGIPLVDVLRPLVDRTAQLRATESYWALVAALADFNFSWEEQQQLERLKPAAAPGQPPSLEQQIVATRLAAANARLHDAELALIAAQYDLSALAHLPAGQPLPLPVDAPHVGPYRTVLDQLYSGRTVPIRAVLIDRTLPMRQSAIDARATAIVAAADALEAAEEAHFAGHADLALVLSAVDDLARQRRALLTDVRMYNDQIAEYVMTAPTPQTEPARLVAMLITPSAAGHGSTIIAGDPAAAGAAGGVERAGFNQPITGAVSPGGLTAVPEGTLNLGPPPGFGTAPPAVAPPGQNQPTLAPPKPAPPNGPQPTQKREPARPPREKSTQQVPSTSPTPGAGLPPSPTDHLAYDARKPAAAGGLTERGTTASGAARHGEILPARRDAPPKDAGANATSSELANLLYPALGNMPVDRQARQLAQALCWAPAVEDTNIKQTTLGEYLGVGAPTRRIDAIAGYWNAELQVARAQVLHQQTEQFESLASALSTAATGESRDAAASAMLLVRSAQLAAAADVRRAEADRTAAQCTLTGAVGRPLAGPWIAPSTVPHAGGYLLELDSLPRELRTSPVVERLSSTIPQLRRNVTDHAAAVVASDRARALAERNAAGSLAATAQAVSAIRAQTDETMAFLERLTDYNIEIARYVDAVLPPATSGPTLVRALVSTSADGR